MVLWFNWVLLWLEDARVAPVSARYLAKVQLPTKLWEPISAVCRGFLPGTPGLACLSMGAPPRLVCGRSTPVGRAAAILRPHFKKSPVFFNTFDLPRTRRAMHLRCSYSLTPNFRGCCGASPLALRARRIFFANGPPFYTQLADWPRAHMGPVGFSRGGNGALDRGPLCEGVLGHPRPAQPTVGPSAVVVGHPFVLAPSGFRLRSGVRRIPRWEGCGGRSDPRALTAPFTWVG